MSTGKIGGKIVLEGESQYRAALKGIKTEQSELRSEMKLCQTTFKDNQNSLEALTQKHEILTKQVTSQSEKIDVYRQAIDKASNMQVTATEKLEELKTALSNAEKEMDELSNSSDDTSEAVESQKKLIDELTQKLSDAESNYDFAGKKITYYKTCLNNAESEMQEMQRELEATNTYIKEAESSADKCATSIDEYGKETVEAADRTSAFGDVLKANLASEVIISGIKKLAESIKTIAMTSIESGSSFEASMSKVEALSGATGAELEQLSAKAREMGAATMFSASESADALQYMALAGWDTTQMIEGIEPILNLAAAADMDLAEASDIVTDYLTAFGLEAKDAGKFADEMAYAMANSNTSAIQLGEAYKNCAATAASMGYSVEEVTAVIATMANAGVKGGEAGSALNTIMTRLATNTKECGDALEEYGVYIYDTEGNMNSLSSILEGLSGIWGQLTDQEQASLAKTIAGTNQYSKLQTIMNGLSDAAVESGKSFSDYALALEKCDGSAEEMARTMQDNLKGKVTILKSALEGLEIAAYDCFDDTLKEGVDGATDAVGRLQKSIDSGDLGVSMRKLSNSLGELVEGTIDFGEDALPVAIDGLTWLIDHSELVTAGIAGIVAANMQMKVAGPAVEAVTTAWNAYKTANEGATISQWLLNTAMDANPAGILVTAIVGLTAAVSAYIILNKDNISSMDDTTRATKELVEASKELNDSCETVTAERKTARESMETEATYCKKLAEELEALQYKTSLTTEEQVRQRMIVDELNQVMPDLNLAIDEQTGRLNMSTTALKENVEAMMQSAKAEAAREDLTRIAEEQYEAEKKLYELEQQKIEQDAKVIESENGKVSVYHQARIAQMELEEQIEATKESIVNLETEYESTENYISETGVWEEAAQVVTEVGDAALDAGDDFSGMSVQVQATLAEMQTSMEETISDQMDLFTEFKGEMELTTDELLANMQSQIDGITQWADNLAALADRGINQGLLKSLEDMGPAGAGYVATFVTMTDEELQKANELYAKSISLPSEAAETAVESYVTAGEKAREGFKEGLTEESEEDSPLLISEEETEATKESYAEAGNMAGEGFREGIEESIESVKETTAELTGSVPEQMIETLDADGPSGETKVIGQRTIEGLENGMKENEQNMLNVVASVCAEIVKLSRNELQTSIFVDIGAQIPAGLEKGIRAGKSNVVNAVVEMCTAAVQAGKTTLDINSPSKKFDYLGEMSGTGYIGGWQRSMSNINAIIAASMPDVSLRESRLYTNSGVNSESVGGSTEKKIEVNQEINIYSPTDDLIETTHKFKQAQREAATEW